MRNEKTEVENRVIYPLIADNAPLGTTLSFPPMFNRRSVKTGRLYSVAARTKVKTDMTQYYYWTCSCGAEQAMSLEANNLYRQNSQTFYCVHGHARHYPQGPTEEDKLRKQLDEERRQRQSAEQRVAMWQDDAREAREAAEHERRRANGYKGHATKITKRAKAGVCPCCNRSFENLRRHMATKHPTFTPIEIDAAEGATVQCPPSPEGFVR